ncbi:MAG TPA: TrmH family RNA methyltransferase [Flavobacteriales bacterium]|nr:TrmH family RNA methyltransferase [Flavobacteriales bacterium]
MTKLSKNIQDCLDVLTPLLTQSRLEKFERVLEKRTRHVVMVLEDVYQSRNASAVMRSADGLGIQDVHMIESYNVWSKNQSVSKGASRWLTLHRHLDVDDPHAAAIAKLRARGYRIVATSPHEGGFTPDTLPIDKPVAIVMGTEFKGISDKLMKEVDDYVEIPMYGFSESFNISVASAIVMNRVCARVREAGIDPGLSEEEKQHLRLQWIYRTVKAADAILDRAGLTIPLEK